MNWHGPLRYEAQPPFSTSALAINWNAAPELKTQRGVYVKTVRTERGRGIVYVGTAHGRNGFQGRLELDSESHKRCYLDGRYMLEDPELMRQGTRRPLNYGLLNLELSMRGPQNVQREKLPSDLVQQISAAHAFGIENRQTVLQRMAATPEYQRLAATEPACVEQWRTKLLQGSSVRSAPKPFSQPWGELKRWLRKHYLQEYFDQMQGAAIGAQLLQLFEIYLVPLPDKAQSLALEGTIFQTVCHHPVPWVRQFIQFGIVQPLLQGSAVRLETLSSQCGVSYTQGQEHAEFA